MIDVDTSAEDVMKPTPFTINISEDILADLRARLARARWPDHVPGAGWRYGTDPAYVNQLADYWRDRYDWREQETRLNAFRNLSVPLHGIDLHFIHQPGVGPAPLPLLLLHGWPGSVWEFHKLIPLLTDPGASGGAAGDAFTVVAPSLPGYGFSYRPQQPRFNRVDMANLSAVLMTEVLGYRRFCCQGGDIGAAVALRLAAAYPERLYGIHLNYLGMLRDLRRPDQPTDEEARYLEELQRWLTEEAGYHWIQGTKPQTLAYGLTDSPVGLAAWIVEKFQSWSDCNGDIERCFTKDELLTNIMLYWATGAINASFWPYYSSRHGDWTVTDAPRREVPIAYISFPREIIRPPRSVAERVLNIQRWTAADRGGHFAALEQPEAMAADIRAFFKPFRE
jgi:pimeloyl-ACP methyl ester carboxylesterase